MMVTNWELFKDEYITREIAANWIHMNYNTYHSLVLMWEAKYVSIISHATHGNDFVDVKLYVFAQQSRREL